jgi:hypothetical protein
VRRPWHGIVDFVVGDDPWVAVAVVLLIAAAAVGAHLGDDAWWILPAGVPAVVWLSLQRARRAPRNGETQP